MKKTNINLLKSLVCCLAFFTAVPTYANVALPETSSFSLEWLGFNGNVAHGLLTIDNALFPNPSNGVAFLTPGVEIVDFSLSVLDAISGVTSAYQLNDFDLFVWDSLGAIDLSQELVGQEIENKGFWGPGSVTGDAGEFSFFAVEGSGAPGSSGSFFQIATAEGQGNVMTLTSFHPVPLPAAVWLFGSGLCGAITINRRKRVA